MPKMLPDSLTENLRMVARELIVARTDTEECEAVRAFLTACATYRVSVDETGEITIA